MLVRSLLCVVLCELTKALFLLLTLSNSYVSAAAVPHLVPPKFSDPDNTIAAREHTSWSPGVGTPGRPFAEGFISIGTLLVMTPGIREAEGAPSPYLSPSTIVTGLIVRETAAGNPSLPTDTPSGTAGQTTTFSIPVANPSVTFSDPFPPVPLPTEDVDPIPPAPSVPQTGVPTWVWGAGGAGLGVIVLLGVVRVLLYCSRKPQSK